MEHHRHFVAELQPGTLYADRYRILEQIGRGGMGRVYLVEDIRLNGKRRALKLTAALESERETFIREAKMLSELQHPHLPDIVDYYPPDRSGSAVIVMEYIPGDSLAERFVSSAARLPFERVFHYLGQLCDLLCYLHGRKPMIVFRDIKPANVLIDRHERAVLVDFGIARTYRPEAVSDTERLGTPAFAAPEQLRGQQTDARSDLYSWGALAYYLLSGGKFACQRKENVRKMLQSDVPAGFCDLLERLLEDDPHRRPQTAAQLKGLLEPAEHTVSPNRQIRSDPWARDDGVNVAAVLSAYPGAGATFATIGLSRSLSARGIPHALVEWPGEEPELYGWLDGKRAMPKFAAFADPAGQVDAFPAWRHDYARIYPAHPDGMPSLPDAAFAEWVRRLGVPLVIIDLSSKWESSGVSAWLAGSGIQSIWWVADCLPAKWSVRRQEAASELQREAVSRGIRTGWIANRDHPFPQRGEWLSCFPAPPAAAIPLFPSEVVVSAVWRGDNGPLRVKSVPASDHAFQMWSKAVIESHGS